MDTLFQFLKRYFISDLGYRAYFFLGLFWLSLALMIEVLCEWMLFSSALVPGILDYGRLKPMAHFLLLWGAFLSFVLTLAYYILYKELKEGLYVGKKFLLYFHFVIFKLHQLAIVLGLFSILLGFNKGRIYGEAPWFVDSLLSFSLLSFPIAFLVCMYFEKKLLYQKPVLLILFLSFLASFIAYILGNFALPLDLFYSSFLSTGIRDAFLQSFYDTSLLYYLLLASGLAILYYYVPLYYKVLLYNPSTVFFVILTLLCLTPLSSLSLLVYTSTSPSLQTLGIFTNIALNFAIIAGFLNVSHSITRSSKTFRSDAIGLLFRFGIFFIIVDCFLRVFFSLRFTQEFFRYTNFDPFRLENSLAILIFFVLYPACIIGIQTLGERKYSKPFLCFLSTLSILGISFVYLGNFSIAFVESLSLQNFAENKDWKSVFFSTSLFLSKEETSLVENYFFSLRSLPFIGKLLLFFNAFLTFIYALLKLLLSKKKEEDKYELPNLEYNIEKERELANV